jgi:hypothetical protein
MKILEKLKWFLEIRITRDRVNRKIWLCQNSYISKMMTKFHFEEMKIFKSFLAKILRINEKTKHENSNSQRVYVFQQRMRSLNFITIIFRLDIVFATAKLVQFLENSNSNHVMIANRMIAYLNDIKNFVIEFSEKFSDIFLCANDAAFADDELIKKSSNDYFSSCIMISLIDVQLNKSQWLRSTSRQNYWFWVESRRRRFDEDVFSSSFDTTRWKNFTFAAIIVRLFACWKKKCWSLTRSWNMLIFINTDWDTKFKRIESMWVDALLQRCQQTISSRCCLDRSTKNFWNNFIWSTSLIWSRSDQSKHRDARLKKYVEREINETIMIS